ncbi:MAG: c-type cytochrome [Acidobacteria bacterium]|nr:c-type cytochrome [Acidobacteriota bacterium]
MRLALFGAVVLAAAVVKLPTGRADLAAGRKLYENQCALCHGQTGEGGRGPVLTKPRLARAADDAALVRVIEHGISGTEMPGAHSMSERDIRQTAAYVRTLGRVAIKPVPGNAARGAELYRTKGGCAGCHDAGFTAPALQGVGSRRSAVYLREALLTPESAVPDGYLLVTAVPRSGGNVTGVRVNEDSFSIQVRDASGKVHSYWKSELAELRKQRGVSPMPSYRGTFSEDELTDVVAYLASLKDSE